MKRVLVLIHLVGFVSALPAFSATGITGTVLFKGTLPKEKSRDKMSSAAHSYLSRKAYPLWSISRWR